MKLQEYLDKYCINVTKFAMKSGIPLRTLQRIIQGKIPSLNTAILIETASEGKVKPKDLVRP